MKTTRKSLAAQCMQLYAQLAATGHESRKVRTARLAAMGKTIEALKEQNSALQATNSKLEADKQILKDKVEELSGELKAIGEQQE